MHLFGDLVGLSRDLSQLSYVDGSKYICSGIDNSNLNKLLRVSGLDGKCLDDFKRRYKGLFPTTCLENVAVPKELFSCLSDIFTLSKGFLSNFKAISCSPMDISADITTETVLSSEEGYWSLLNVTYSSSSYYKDKRILFYKDAVNPQILIMIKPLSDSTLKKLRVNRIDSNTISMDILGENSRYFIKENYDLRNYNGHWFVLKSTKPTSTYKKKIVD